MWKEKNHGERKSLKANRICLTMKEKEYGSLRKKNVLRQKKISHNKARKKSKTIVINETIYSVHLL